MRNKIIGSLALLATAIASGYMLNKFLKGAGLENLLSNFDLEEEI